MKANYILGAALILGTLSLCTSCDNYFDEKYLNNGQPAIPVKPTMEYLLLPTDYVSIANSSVNKAKAAETDSINNTRNRYQKALARVGTEYCFNSYITADKYVPAFLSTKYPQLDPGSIINVNYDSNDGLPKYLLPYNGAIRVELATDDEAEIPALLPQPDEGQVIGALYAEGTKEAIYECLDGYTWTPAVFPATVDMHLLPLEANGQVTNWLKRNYPYVREEQEVVVMYYDDASKAYVAYEFVFDGEEWNPNTGIVEETMMFTLDEKKGWITDLSTYYKQAVVGEGLGNLTLHHYDLQEGISYIWRYDTQYGMRGSAYANAPHSGEGWFVTPKIKLKSSVSPALSFDMALNKGPLDDLRFKQIGVYVSTDFKNDARSATWTQLPWNEWDAETQTGFPAGDSWTFYPSGRMDLSAWNGQAIYIGFKYKTEPGEGCPTWEVKNILVAEPEAEAEAEEKAAE